MCHCQRSVLVILSPNATNTQYYALLAPVSWLLVLPASEALLPDGFVFVFFLSCRLQSKKLLAPPLRPGTAPPGLPSFWDHNIRNLQCLCSAWGPPRAELPTTDVEGRNMGRAYGGKYAVTSGPRFDIYGARRDRVQWEASREMAGGIVARTTTWLPEAKRGETFYASLCIAGSPVGNDSRRPYRAPAGIHLSFVVFGSTRPSTRTRRATRVALWACRPQGRQLPLRIRIRPGAWESDAEAVGPARNPRLPSFWSTVQYAAAFTRALLGARECWGSEPSVLYRSFLTFLLSSGRVGAPPAKRTGTHADRNCDNAGLLRRGGHWCLSAGGPPPPPLGEEFRGRRPAVGFSTQASALRVGLLGVSAIE